MVLDKLEASPDQASLKRNSVSGVAGGLYCGKLGGRVFFCFFLFLQYRFVLFF